MGTWDASVATGTLGHALHYLLVLAGLAGVAVLLLPQALDRHGAVAPRRQAQPDLHAVRVASLRAALDPSYVAPPLPPPPPVGDRLVLPLAVTASAAAAGVHAAAWPSHDTAPLAVASFFVVAALAQLGWACAASLVSPSRALLEAGLLGNAAIVATWLVTRTVGLGDLAPVEAVGAWDLLATAWEVVVVACCVVLLRRPGRALPLARWRDWAPAAHRVAVGSVLVLALLPLAGAPS